MPAQGATLPRVVIIGGGFGGLSAARALARTRAAVTLVDRHNYHLFQPLLYQAATAALTPSGIAEPVRGILRGQRNTTVFMDAVTGIDRASRCVRTAGGRVLRWDYLVVATGARHSYFGRDHWADHAPGLKTLDDAMKLRHRILSAFEQAEMETADADRRRALLTFVIVGGGPTGVEMAGSIAELARSIAHDFRNVSTHCAHVVLAEAGERVLAQFHPRLSARARRDLEEMGVDVRTGTRVEDVGGGRVNLNGEPLRAETVIWAAGVQASPAGAWLGAATDRAGRVIVNADLTVPGMPDVYVIGDTAAFTPAGAAAPLPGVAPVAKQQGAFAGRRIASLVAGRRAPARFRYRDFGSMATIGRHRAVADIRGLHCSGLPGWLLWSVAHIYFLVGFRSRALVALTWLWAYVTWQRGSRLITGMGFNVEEKGNEHTSEDSEPGAAGRGRPRRVRVGRAG
jgi:NADH dehydrogenase